MSESLEATLRRQRERIKNGKKLDFFWSTRWKDNLLWVKAIKEIVKEQEEKIQYLVQFYFFEELEIDQIVNLMSTKELRIKLNLKNEIFSPFSVLVDLEKILAKFEIALTWDWDWKFSAARYSGKKKEGKDPLSWDENLGNGLDLKV